MIPIQDNLTDIEFLKKDTTKNYKRFLMLPPMEPFSEEIITYLDALSKSINIDSRIREFPDVATFSFFCRKSNIKQLKNKYYDEGKPKLGRGVVFHIAPSNVPVNFAFSLVMGLLMGNSNIVRVPSKHFIQINIIIDAINKLAADNKYSKISNRIILVRYDRNSNATSEFSLNCDVRVIWGGDETINNIRKNPIKSRAYDITFADRYSICIINADKFIDEPNPEIIVNGFYNDTFLFDQNACTSPHLLTWIGTSQNVKCAKKGFWEKLYLLVENKYEVQPVSVVNKLTNFCSQAIQMNDVKLEKKKDNLIWRVNLNKLEDGIDKFQCDSGYFGEYHASSPLDLSKIINRKYQTLAYYGFSTNELANFFQQLNPVGIDRIVPIGRTMDFSLIWDGFDLTNSLSRTVEIV